MATDLERMIAQLEVSLTKYEKGWNKALGVTEKQSRAIERRAQAMSKKLDAVTGAALGRTLVPALAAITGALTVREVAAYADAWTRTKNSLAVAGVTGQAQVAVLDALYQSAQKNAAPIESLAGLYGKAAQASDVLGASQAELLRFTDGVAVALKVAGTDAQGASGALMQLGQLLGSARVQAEEFNSVNEGARPILQAVAAGLDAAGGSVSKLKTLVTDGKVSGQQFFNAFLRGLPAIEAAAANATQTLDQGFTKVGNALTKYIGQSDQSLGATQRLVTGLNALADNFAEVADTTVMLAGIIAAALLGRAIGPMIARLGIATVAVTRFVASLRAATIMSQTAAALGGISVAAGPIGAVVGVAAAGALYLFASRSQEAARQAAVVEAELERMGIAAGKAAERTNEAAEAVGNLGRAKALDAVTDKIEAFEAAIGKAEGELADMQDGLAMLQFDQVNTDAAETAKKFDVLVEQWRNGRISAEQLRAALDVLAGSLPDHASQIAAVADLTDKIDGERTAVAKLREEYQRLAGATDAAATRGQARSARPAEAASMAALERDRAAAKGVLDEEARQAKLTEAQRDLEDEMARLRKEIEKAGGLVPSQAALQAAAQANLDARGAGKATPFPDDVAKSYADRVIAAESGGDPNAKNAASSATGVGQFIESTWLDLFRRYYPEQAQTMGRDAILRLRTDAGVSRQLIEAYARENADVLRRAGVSVDEAALHLSHFLGAGDAAKVLTAAKGTPLAGLISGQSIAANPTILGSGRTVDDAIAYAQRRANQARIGAGDLTPAEELLRQQAESDVDIAAASEQRIADLQAEAAAVGKTVGELARLNEMQALRNSYMEAGIPLTAELNEYIAAQGERAATAAEKLAGLQKSSEGVAQAQQFFAEGATGAFTDVITGAATAEDAIRRLANSLLEATIQAALLGQGPLAGIFGTAAPTASGLGGLFGALFGAKAAGGPVSRTGAYLVGERGPEVVNLPTGAHVVPNYRIPDARTTAAGGGIGRAGPVEIRIRVDGAKGNREIEDMVQRGVAAGIGEYRRVGLPHDVPNLVNAGRRRGTIR